MIKNSRTKKVKKNVWKEIAEELNKRGFKLNADDPGEKVHQKWRNMEREYRSFLDHQKKTGEGKKKQPEFFDKLHKLLSVRHSVNPVAISDSSEFSEKAGTPKKSALKKGTSEASTSSHKPAEKPSGATHTGKRKHLLKSEKNEEVINLIKSMHKENKRSEEKRFESEMKFFNTLQQEMANQHKERMTVTYDLINALKNN